MEDDPMTLPHSVSRPIALAAGAIFLLLIGIVVWAVYAPLATTIRANGTLASVQPAYDIQHPYGGRIAQVLVTPQAEVKRGDLLLVLDVGPQRRSLELLRQQIARLEVENLVIRQKLGLKMTGPPLPDDDPVVQSVRVRYRALRNQLTLDVQAAEQEQHRAQVRAQATERAVTLSLIHI